MMITSRLLNHSNFIGYHEDLKEEMQQNAILKMFKMLHNLKEEYKNSFFNYLTRTAYCSFLTTIGEYYKQKNLLEELKEKYVNEFCIEHPHQKQTMNFDD